MVKYNKSIIKTASPKKCSSIPTNAGASDSQIPRILYLYGEVTTDLIGKLTEQIIAINRFDDANEVIYADYVREPIEIYIDSEGGEVYPTLGFIDLIRSSETPVTTVAMGKIMSAAFDIFITGDVRVAHKNSVFMTHQLSAGTFGCLKEMTDDIDVYKSLNDMLLNHVVDRTKLDRDELVKYFEMRKDYYIFGGNKAVELGIADDIVSDKSYTVVFKDGIAIPFDNSMSEEEREAMMVTINDELDKIKGIDRTDEEVEEDCDEEVCTKCSAPKKASKKVQK